MYSRIPGANTVFVCCLEQIASGGLLSPLCSPGPASMTVRAQTRKRKGARPRWGSRDRRGWARKRRAVGLSWRLLQLTHKSASSLSALLLASTFWMELHVPFAEQQVPLQFLVPAVPPWCSEWGWVRGAWCLVERGVGGSGWLVGGFALGGLVVVGGWVSERCRGTEVNGTTPQRLVSVGLPTLAPACIST